MLKEKKIWVLRSLVIPSFGKKSKKPRKKGNSWMFVLVRIEKNY